MRTSGDPLLRALTGPDLPMNGDMRRWDELLAAARRTGLAGRLAARFETRREQIPERVRRHLESAEVGARDLDRLLHWEVDRVRRALADSAIRPVLLKGGAYALANLPLSRGRASTDLDILVPRESIGRTEEALLRRGWEPIKLDVYDQRYYRTWMHELPPLRHNARRTVIDIHHNILPRTSRLRPDADALLADSTPLLDGSVAVLSARDMVLHCATHLFHDGDFEHGLRELVDLDELLRHFGRDAEFWTGLAPRAKRLDLLPPLFYGLRYARAILETPIPDSVVREARAGAPSGPALLLMDALVRRAVVQGTAERPTSRVRAAKWLLYVRSHRLRMPPWLLARHLLHKRLARGVERPG